mgnify:CR=1 FL=1
MPLVSDRCICLRKFEYSETSQILTLFSREELQEMIDEGGSEVVCQFCGRRYDITREELIALTAKRQA